MDYRKIFYKLVLLTTLALLIGACSGSETPAEPAADVDQEPVSEQTEVVAAEEEEDAAPESEITPATLTPTTAVEDAPAAVEADEGNSPTPPTPGPAESPANTPVPAVKFNGTYEGTYYRGAADAPVTMFDYSDFL